MFLRLVFLSAIFIALGAIVGLALNYRALRELRSGTAPKTRSQLEEKVGEEAAPKIATYSGTLKPLDPSIYMEGTHYLEDDSGEVIILIRGGAVEREFLQLLEGQRVEVEGVVEDTVEGDQKILNVEKVIL